MHIIDRIPPRLRAVGFWTATLIIAVESLVGGFWDVLRIDYVIAILEEQLELPYYVAILLGVGKIPGAIVLVLPRFPRLKEWTYAGIMFVYTGAVAAHTLTGDPAAAVGPLGFSLITMISWSLRPQDKRDPAPYSPRFARLLPRRPDDSRTRSVLYWGTTIAFTAALFSGGIADLVHNPPTVAGMVLLGYPPYFLYIIGFWKVLSPFALLPRGLGRLKEWAYAGAFFNFTGAVASHALSGSAWYHLAYTGFFAVCVLVSWASRPDDRVLGDRYPRSAASAPAAEIR